MTAQEDVNEFNNFILNEIISQIGNNLVMTCTRTCMNCNNVFILDVNHGPSVILRLTSTCTFMSVQNLLEKEFSFVRQCGFVYFVNC